MDLFFTMNKLHEFSNPYYNTILWTYDIIVISINIIYSYDFGFFFTNIVNSYIIVILT